jgi:hypothetical protein
MGTANLSLVFRFRKEFDQHHNPGDAVTASIV